MLTLIKTKPARQNFFVKFRRVKNFIRPSAYLLPLLMPYLALAQSKVQEGLENSGLQSSFGSNGLLGATSAQELIVKVIELLLGLAGAIAVVFLIIGGYQYLVSAGNEETAEKGKKTLINSIIGIIIIVLSYAIVSVIADFVSTDPIF